MYNYYNDNLPFISCVDRWMFTVSIHLHLIIAIIVKDDNKHDHDDDDGLVSVFSEQYLFKQ